MEKMKIDLLPRIAWLGKYEITVWVAPGAINNAELNLASTYVKVPRLHDELSLEHYPEDALLWLLYAAYHENGTVDDKVSAKIHRHISDRLSVNMSLRALFNIAKIVDLEMQEALEEWGYGAPLYDVVANAGETLYMASERQIKTPAVVDESADEFVTSQLAKVDESTGLKTVHVTKTQPRVVCKLYPQLVCETMYDDATLKRLLKRYTDSDGHRLIVRGGTVILNICNGLVLSDQYAPVDNYVKSEKEALEHLDVLARAKELLDGIGFQASDLDNLKEAYNADGVH